jgi:hypothetical protein
LLFYCCSCHKNEKLKMKKYTTCLNQVSKTWSATAKHGQCFHQKGEVDALICK